MSFDLNLENYRRHELEEIFGLSSNYNDELISLKEQQLIQNILSDPSVDNMIKNKTVAFLNSAKNILVNFIKNGKGYNKESGPLQTIASTYNQIYNIDHNLAPSKVIESNNSFIIKPQATPYGQSSPSEFYQGTLNPLNKRILRKSLNIDTRFRENYYGTKSSNFHLDLPMRMTEVVSMQLTALEFPTSFYNLSKAFGSNFFTITIPSTSESIVVSIPDGNYSSDALACYLNTYLESLTTTQFQYIYFTVDIAGGSGSGRMVVGIKTPEPAFNFTLNFQQDKNGQDDRSTPLPLKMGWMMGFRNGLYENNATYVSEGVVDLLGPRYMYLVVDDFNNSVSDGFYAAFTSSILNKNILARISLQGSVFSYTSQNNFNLITYARQYFGPVDLQKLQIQLLDEYGRIVDLNNMDYSMCLTMQSIYDL